MDNGILENSADGSTSTNSIEQNSKDGKVLHPDLINANIKNTVYAVRGELYLRAEELKKQGKEIIFTNIGNPQALGSKPYTFSRQVLSLVLSPFLLENPKVKELFPSDAIERAKHIIKNIKTMGAYTHSMGAPFIRQEVAKFIEERDGYPSDPERIFLTDGASVGVKLLLDCMIRNENDCIFVPIPQYPLYSATITLRGGSMIGYYLEESEQWALDLDRLRESIHNVRKQGKNARGLVFINPGNPTGQCLSESNLRDLIKLAHEEKMVVMADEVYQENVYQSEKPFISAKKIINDMGEPYDKSVELVSFHSISKGIAGECGLRGGFFELTNIHDKTVSELYKMVSISLSPNTVGQVSVSLLINPVKLGQESYNLYIEEKNNEKESLIRRAKMVSDALNSLKNFSCNSVEGAMYAFPKIMLPEKAVAAAEAAGKEPDVFYCLKLLEATGISTVPGSGFGQENGTFHFRTTILPREEKMKEFCDMFQKFNDEFMAEYS